MKRLSVIFGTHRIPKESILYALNHGITTLDTATGYSNSELIGNALKDIDFQANIITKFNTNDFKGNIDEIANSHHDALVDHSINVILSTVLIHSPLDTNEENLIAFIKLKKLFPNAAVGVSNFDIQRIQHLIDAGSKPDLVSIEFHPYYQSLKLVQFCTKHGIAMTGYRAFAKGQVFADPLLAGIAKKHNTSIMDVVLSWNLLNGVAPTVSSSKEKNIDNIIKFNNRSEYVQLDSDDLNKIKSLNRGINGSTCMLKYCDHD